MNKRKIRLINRRLQGRFLLFLLLGSGASVLTHAALLSFAFSSLATELPNDGQALLDALPRTIAAQALIALALIVPAFLILGIASSLRVFGPLYRFRAFLEAVAAGEHAEPCQLRRNDELHDICELLNQATATTREGQASNEESRGELERAA